MFPGCRCPAKEVYAAVVKRLGVQYLKEAAADQERAVEEHGPVLAGAIERVIDRIRVLEDDPESREVINAELSLRMASIADGTADLVDYEDVKRASAEAGRRFIENKGSCS